MAAPSPVKKAVRDERINARRALLEELFNDMYDDRRAVYVMNFFRGLFFGLGSVIGGTIVVGLIIWVLSFFVHFPGIGQSVENAQDQLQGSQKK